MLLAGQSLQSLWSLFILRFMVWLYMPQSAKVMQNALRDFKYGDLIGVIASHTTGLEPAIMEVNKTLVSVPAAPWNVTEAYCKKGGAPSYKNNYGCTNLGKLQFLQKLPTVGTMERKQLTVTVNGLETVYTLGKKNEYYNSQGTALNKTLETLAAGKGNKISIH